MDEELLREVQTCLRGERTIFQYYPDQYAIYLLSRSTLRNGKIAIRDLKKSQFSSLLDRPAVKSFLQHCGNGELSRKALQQYWPYAAEPYVLTLGEWGGNDGWEWNQISRPGKNLVLQLNVSKKWANMFHAALREPANDFFDCGHPLSDTRPFTLAWARLDIDFCTDEVLIEEIQSDSIRNMACLYRAAGRALSQGRQTVKYYGADLGAQNVADASGAFLDQFKKSWQEAMLTATIRFVFEELGISNLYYHSFETGNALKNLSYSYPPRSLYVDLPKKFCFSATVVAPVFLNQEKRLKRKLRKLDGGRWFHMAA